MQDLSSIKVKISDMSKIAFEMWQLSFRAFMEHNLDLISTVLDRESKLNDLEKEITVDLVELGRSSSEKDEKSKIMIFADIAEDLELIGDYCKDILERVQIKIDEKLLFSDDAVREYSELYHKTERTLEKVVSALDKDKPSLLKELLRKEEDIDNLVDGYRERHNQRLIAGVCSPLACNMFLNMLDFTGAIYHHTKKIAKNILRLE